MHACYVLHTRPFRNTSLLLELFSDAGGRLPVVARGIRGSRPGMQGSLRPFTPLLADWRGRGEVKTLSGVEASAPPLPLTGARLYCGLYLNELLMRLLPRDDPHERVFGYYAQCLRALAEARDVERELRLFEKRLLDELGYGLVLDREAETGRAIEAERRYVYQAEAGAIPAPANGHPMPSVHGATLLSLAAEALDDPRSLAEARGLMRVVLAHHLGDRPLRSRELFRQEATDAR